MTGRRIAMTTEPTEDVSARVQQRFTKLEAAEHDAAPARPPRPPEPAPAAAAPGLDAAVVEAAVASATASLQAHIDEHLDTLRQELEGAFEEVVGKLDLTGRALRLQHNGLEAIVTKVDALGAAASRQYQQLAALAEAQAELAASGMGGARPGGVDAEGEARPVEVDLSPLVPPLAALDAQVRDIAARLDALPAAGEPAAVDAASIADAGALAEAVARVEAELAGQRADLNRMAHAVRATKDDGEPIDRTYLEEVMRRGAVANAADIANLRTDVDQFTTALRDQTEALVELRKQTEWIRQRLLGR